MKTEQRALSMIRALSRDLRFLFNGDFVDRGPWSGSTYADFGLHVGASMTVSVVSLIRFEKLGRSPEPLYACNTELSGSGEQTTGQLSIPRFLTQL